MPHFHAFCFPRLVIVAFLQIPIDRGRRGYLYVNSKLHAVDFYGKWILSDEQQIGPRLEKEIEMYCSKRGFRKLKDIVLLRKREDEDALAMAPDLHREENDILHKYWDFFTTYSFGNILWKSKAS